MENKIYKFGLKGDQRKALVSAMQQLLQVKMEYLGAPTFAYQLGDYHIDKHGTVTGPESLNLMVGLLERGFEPEADPSFHLITPRGTLLCQRRYDTAAEAEADGYNIAFHHEGRDVFMKPAPDGKTEHSKWFAVVGAPFEEAPEPEADVVCIEVPAADFTPEAIENLRKMVAAKEALIKKALSAEALPIEVGEETIGFPWFAATTDGDHINAYAQFIAALTHTARTKKRVNAKAPENGFENESFAMRVWLIGLGLVGPDFKLARALLGRGLSGSTAWRYGAPEKAAPAPQEETPAAAPAEEITEEEERAGTND